ncbi:MAG: winged helix-turn-helix domain-containing protein [bacterium]|nr:winged helix-turn-helix domain-containing protein [bacterium]
MSNTKEITLTINEQVNQINDRIIDLSEQLPQLLSARKYSEAKLTVDSIYVLLNVLEKLSTIENELARLPELLSSLTQSTQDIIQLESKEISPKPSKIIKKPVKKVIVEKKSQEELVATQEKKSVKKVSKKSLRKGRPTKEEFESAERLPRHEQKDFYFPILEVLQENNGRQTGALTILGIKNKIGDTFLAGDYEFIGSNKAPRWQVVARWAQNKLKQLGLVTSLERGIWALTDTGKALVNGKIQFTPEQIDKMKVPITIS